MSHTGRRRAARARPSARFAATIAAFTLAAGAVPAALLPDGPVRHQSAPGQSVAQRAAAAPVDQIRAREWHLNAMRIPRAWRLSKGAGVTVAVLDTGVDRRHPDLAGRVINGPDLTGGTRRPGSRYWGLHGTSMASVIAGHGNGPGQERGVIGVAPQSRILSIRVTWESDDPQRRSGSQVSAHRDAVARGIRYAVDNGADVINMSLGGGRLFYNGNPTEESAIQYALSKGVVLIAAAGNDGAGANRNNFPAAYRGVVAVGALDRRSRMWKDSNRRPYVAVCAPGVEIVSADSSNGYAIVTGTSPSSAIVAGVAALIRARHPRLKPEEVRQALVRGVVPNRPTGSSVCRGPLDALRALNAAGKIAKAGGGSDERPAAATPTPAPRPESAEEEDGTLLITVLGGGAVLLGLGVLMGWRQRRKPEGDFEDVDDYGLVMERPPPQSAGAMAGQGAPPEDLAAPVNAPLWQSNDAFPGPPAPVPGVPSRNDTTPAWPPPPVPTSPSAPAPASTGQPSAESAPPIPSELRPFIPGDAVERGRNGHTATNGSHDLGHLNGFGEPPPAEAQETPVPSYGDPPPVDDGGENTDYAILDDEEWERFRRSALEGPGLLDDDFPVPREESGPGASPPMPDAPVHPADDKPTAFPPAPPPGLAGKEPPGAGVPLDDDPFRGPRHGEDDDYRPPWW